jgi:hypothetical protein
MTGPLPRAGWVGRANARRAVARVLGVAVGLVVWAWPGAGLAGASVTTTVNFTSPGVYSFTVPAGVSSLSVTAIGGAGGSSVFGGCTSAGGEGASVSATLPVSAGEQLQAGVGAVGGNAPCGGGTSGGAGGAGGGASGGNAASQIPGAGGGGASSLGLPALSPGFNSLLVVAGGGGGAGGLYTGTGGNAGAAGASTNAGGGGAGTSSAGGAGGSAAGGCSATGSGTQGAFAVGGAGGAGGTPIPIGGGGGGGGFYGGGGGGGNCEPSFLVNSDSGGGGGGGSSFVAQGVLTATPTSAAAEVSITYAVPTADLSTSASSFTGTQPLGVASAEQRLTVTNNGSAPLIVSGASLSGSNPGDYLLDNRCQSPVSPGSSCVVGVRFDPQAQGASSASVALQTNALTQPAPVTLSGSGGSLPQGPTGAAGQTGARGPAGKNGLVELVTCKTVTRTVIKTIHGKHTKVKVRKQVCTTKTVTGPVKFTTASAARAVLSRGRVIYATGIAGLSATHPEMILSAARRLRPGRYTLTRRWTTGRTNHTRRQTIMLR